jgi:adenylyltransferase/sulfurtransferase
MTGLASPVAPSTGTTDALPELTREEILRYSRHLILPDVGVAGQRKLKAARVLLVGAGGLGSPAALYLAAAGIGHLGVVDFDTVDVTNLHRQVLHGTADVGRSKLASATDRLRDVNPHVHVEPYETRLTAENALEIIAEHDLVVDGTDNFATRYLVNDACVILDRPNVYGSIFRFEGQASVLATPDGPCYRCLFREPPPPGLVPSCAEGGVLGVLPGLVGTIQATEAIKLVLGIGEPLIGRLLLVDALALSFRTMTIRRDPTCPACGTREIRELIDYDAFCGAGESTPASSSASSHSSASASASSASSKSSATSGPASGPTSGSTSGPASGPTSGPASVAGHARVAEVTPIEVAERLARGDDFDLIDVREEYEWEICRIDGAKLVPLSTFPAAVASLDPSREIVVQCKVGGRSARVAALLVQSGFPRVSNLVGGITRWSDEVDPSIPKY